MGFKDTFSEPIKDYYADTGWAVSREHYTKEEAAALFSEAAKDEGLSITKKEFIGTIKKGHTKFHFGSSDYGDIISQWWWDYGGTNKPGDKEIWLAY